LRFNEWLKEEFGQTWQGINDDLLVEGFTEEDRDNEYSRLTDDYEDWCDDEGLIPDID
jgi:hypothetical protein